MCMYFMSLSYLRACVNMSGYEISGIVSAKLQNHVEHVYIGWMQTNSPELLIPFSLTPEQLRC